MASSSGQPPASETHLPPLNTTTGVQALNQPPSTGQTPTSPRALGTVRFKDDSEGAAESPVTRRISSKDQRVETFDSKKSASSFDESWAPQFVLCLDGGGVRGYSTLLILKRLMEIIERLEKAEAEDPAQSSVHPASDLTPLDGNEQQDELPKSKYFPCHYFDYMFGTSTGGLIAIMLGRLRMSVDEAISAYESLSKDVFGKPRVMFSARGPLPHPRGKYNHRNLANIIKTLVNARAATPAAERRLQREQLVGGGAFNWEPTFNSEPMMCRTVCLAYCAAEACLAIPFLFRSYEHIRSNESWDRERGLAQPLQILERNPGPAHAIPIWKVARATSAAPTYFDPMEIDGYKFLDGGFGCNNPSQEAYIEVRSMHNENIKALGLLLSLGTGESKESRFAGKWARLYQYFRAAKKLASDSRTVHMGMLTHSENGARFPYYRFDVKEGLGEMKLDEWHKAHNGKPSTRDYIREMTEKYLNGNFDAQYTVNQKLEVVAETLVGARRRRASTPRWEMVALGTRYRCPLLDCHNGQKVRNTALNLRKHLCTTHKMPVGTDVEVKAVDVLVKEGRITRSDRATDKQERPGGHERTGLITSKWIDALETVKGCEEEQARGFLAVSSGLPKGILSGTVVHQRHVTPALDWRSKVVINWRGL